MFRAAVVLALAGVLLAALALISCLSVEDRRQIRGLPRGVWVLVILLVPLAGPASWFWLGRPKPVSGFGGSWRTATGFREPPRPRAPDDDPDFLRSIGGQEQRPTTPTEEDLLQQWEEDLHRREDDRRRGDNGSDN